MYYTYIIRLVSVILSFSKLSYSLEIWHKPEILCLEEYWNVPCNTTCCSIFDFCASTETSTCCPAGTILMSDPSGLTALCCSPGQYNGGGICCNDGTEFCAGRCCPGTCQWLQSNPGSPTCTATVAGCEAQGDNFTGQLCTTVADCTDQGGESYSESVCNQGCCNYVYTPP